ncbi:hypothetical protein GBA52_020396 [Prunus armeniaca]|nr:hypothetical protein GBA52_020396 [Prunus armeniaca]
MASKLKVEELRNQLAQRGLTTTGNKPTLASLTTTAIFLSLFSRWRVNWVRENQGHRRVPGVKQLREQATLRGISATGSKKELLERLSEDSDDIPLGGANEDGNGSKEKIVTATKKGAAVLDQWLPDHIKAHYHGDDVYDAMLNQTNVGYNNNKFYVIQVLESDAGGTFMVYYRWGRVGVKGQNKIQGPYTSRDINEFKQKFYDKTKNDWSNRKMFESFPHHYMWIEMDYNEEEKQLSVQEKNDSALRGQPLETPLEPRIAKFISLICNISMMKQHMMEIGYNADKLPLAVKAAEPDKTEKLKQTKTQESTNATQPSTTTASKPPKKPVYSMKKGQIVRVEKEKYLNSVNYLSVGHPPYYKGLDYIYEDRGEVLDLRIFETGEYALVAWVGVPTAPAWLPTEMLIKSSSPSQPNHARFHPLSAAIVALLDLTTSSHFSSTPSRYCFSSTSVNNDHGASCYVRVGDHSGGGFPHAHSVVRSAISSLTFKRRWPSSRDLAWVAFHLGSIALIHLFKVLDQVFGH